MRIDELRAPEKADADTNTAEPPADLVARAVAALNRLAGYERYAPSDFPSMDDLRLRCPGIDVTPNHILEELELDAEEITIAREAMDVYEVPVAIAGPGRPIPMPVANLRLLDALLDVGRSDVDSSASASREHPDEAAAREAFAAQATRLFDINQWDQISGMENATFTLYDSDGNPTSRTVARPGDFVRIDLPGPGPYDWVRVEDASVTRERAEITVRPSHDPTADPIDESVTAHFFTSEATNTFSVERDGTTVTARVEGRNENANVGDESGDAARAARNRATAEGAWGLQLDVPGVGRVNGMQQHQWDTFTQHLVDLGSSE